MYLTPEFRRLPWTDCLDDIYLHKSYNFFASLDKEKYKTFFCLYCEIYKKIQFPKIWKSHQDKLPTAHTIENLFRWNTLNKSWNDHDTFGCILPNVADNIVRTPIPAQDLGEARYFVKTVHRVIRPAHFQGESSM